MPNFLTSFINRFRASLYLDPERDWLVSIITSTFIVMGIIVWNAWAFDTVANGGVIGSPATTTAPTFSQSSLDTVHSIFAARALEEAKYMSSAYHYADPSL